MILTQRLQAPGLIELGQRVLVYGLGACALAGLAMQVGPPSQASAEERIAAANAAALLPPLTADSSAAQPTSAPAGLFELTLHLERGGDLSRILTQAGVGRHDAESAAKLGSGHIGADDDADLKLALSKDGKAMRIERLALLTDNGATLIQRQAGELMLVPAASVLRKTSVTVAGSLYWTLRAAEIDAEAASEASAIAERRGATAGDRLTVAFGLRPGRFGEASSARLVYVGLQRAGRQALQLLRWPGVPGGWIDPRQPSGDGGLMRPVPGAITSTFGLRFHPILHFLRFHSGVDFAAGWGEPVRAAADGVVADAGWHGGYGRQVRLEHGGQLGTSYSHLSEIIVQPGERVHKGEVVGLAGASGLATGPHLHFEVYRGGQRIDPLSVRVGSGGGPDHSAIETRLLQINSAPAA